MSAQVVDHVDRPNLQGFVIDTAKEGAVVYIDENRAYLGLPLLHGTVKHSVREYVLDQAHTNGIESFWAILKRGYMGTFHQMSEKHLGRYVTEFEGRHNQRPLDTIAQMGQIASGMVGKRLKYQDLIG